MAEKRPKNAPMKQIAKSVHADLMIVTPKTLLLHRNFVGRFLPKKKYKIKKRIEIHPYWRNLQ